MAGLPNIFPHLLHPPSRLGWRQGPGAGPGRPAPAFSRPDTGCLCPLVSPSHPAAPKFRSIEPPQDIETPQSPQSHARAQLGSLC